ncbi:DCN1 [Sanghuangporus weigelae]
MTFKSLSDAKLASLYLENAKDFPLDLLSKFFDIILDPTFKLEDVTFKNHQNVFEYVSEYRARALAISAGKDNLAPTVYEKLGARSGAKTNPAVAFPSVIVSHVVARLVQDQLPLGVAAMEASWKSAYRINVSDFLAMSLVHRSWTPFARRGLRRRAVVPFNQMDKFLLSPLCGSWITELILYWDVYNGRIGVTLSDIAILEALLKRLPALRSLAFNTCHVWRKADLSHYKWNASGDQPPFRVDRCLELIADLLPKLENLWLKHYRGYMEAATVVKHIESIWLERTLDFCSEMPRLYRQLPKMQSLRFLSLRSWTCTEEVDLQAAPAASLKTIELADLDKGMADLKWLLEPREEYKPTAISVDTRNYSPEEEVLPGLEKLQILADDSHRCSRILSNFPESLEYFAVHFHGDGGSYEVLLNALSPTSRFVSVMRKCLDALPRLQTLVLTEALEISIEQFVDGELDGFIFYMALSAKNLKESVSKEMNELCEKRDVELIVQHATCTPVCDRYFCRYDQPEREPDPDDQYERDILGLRPGPNFGSVFGVGRTLSLASQSSIDFFDSGSHLILKLLSSNASFRLTSCLCRHSFLLPLQVATRARDKGPGKDDIEKRSEQYAKSAADRQLEANIVQFCNVTGASTKDARKFLEKYKRLDSAIDNYYNDPSQFGGGGGSKRAEADRSARLSAIFDKYKDPESDDILIDGTIKLCEDLEVNPEDVVLLSIAYELKAPSMGRWTRKGWIDGWRNLGQDTIEGMRKTLSSLSQKLASDARYFQQVYNYTFDFARSEGQRSLALDDAQGFWSLLIPHGLSGGALRHEVEDDDEDEAMAMDEEGWKPEYTDWWFEFLREKGGKGVSKDTWQMFLEFIRAIDSKFEKYDETAAWPSTIDDFVVWAREKRSQAAGN